MVTVLRYYYDPWNVLFQRLLYFLFQEKILEEYYKVAGAKELSLEILSKLTWLEACIKESWRVYPVTPLIARQIYHPITICKYKFYINTRFRLFPSYFQVISKWHVF